MVLDLPVILAGPMIRRTEKSKVFIMTVTSEKMSHIRASFYYARKRKDDYVYLQQKVRSVTSTVKLGDSIYVNMTKISPVTGYFPANQLICYNLHFTYKRKTYDLSHFGLLTKQLPHSVIYGSLKFPSFFISSPKSMAPILYGSCRKLHGTGEDALLAADLFAEDVYDNINRRPQALFLMGDQIYADDVADPVFPFICQLGHELTGYKREQLWYLDPHLAESELLDLTFKIRGRENIVKGYAKFTSSSAFNQLIYFNEFLAMYLLAFSPDIWELFLTQHLRYFEEHIDSNKYAFSEMKGNDYQKYKSEYEEQVKQLKSYSNAVAHVRRLLANTPSYMIFDDHDITDDWNISYEWKMDVQQSPLGNLIVANGLTAYWAFQGWGNDPATFDNNFIRTLTSYISKMDVTGKEYLEWSSMMWKFNKWEFFAPTNPKAIFLDTRTKRQYEQKNGEGKPPEKLPRLINNRGWKNIDRLIWKSGWEKGDMLLFISPYPLYGADIVEEPIKKVIYPLESAGINVRNSLDMEAWKYNRGGFKDFHRQLLKLKTDRTIILSGDVHYAFSYETEIKLDDECKTILQQFTSSPIKNESVHWLADLIFNSSMIASRLKAGMEQKVGTIRNRTVSEKGDYKRFNIFQTVYTENNIGYLSFNEDSAENSYITLKNGDYNYLNFKG